MRMVVAGGGTAGWMTAAAIARTMGHAVKLTLVESEEIGTIGVGESTVPTFRGFHNLMGIKEDVFMSAAQATVKLGIEFRNWARDGDRYIHPFGDFGPNVNGVPFYQFWLRLRALGDTTRLDEYSLGIMLAVRMVPPKIMAEHRAAAMNVEGKPRSLAAAVAIVAIWLAAIALAGWLVLR